MPQWCEGLITDRQVWSPGLFTIRVQVEGVEPFFPGQFLQLGLLHREFEDQEYKLINRPYSVASPHGDHLEFFIVMVDGGQLTPKLWELRAGDKMLISQRAAGSFTLEKSPPGDNLWLFGTGTGLAPYIAMLRSDYVWAKYRRIFLIHGVRKVSDLAYTEELIALEKKFPDRFRFVRSLTRDEASDCLTGRIPDLIENGTLEQYVNLEMTQHTSSVLLCGNPAMLNSMEQLLDKRGMRIHRSKSPGNVVLERYW